MIQQLYNPKSELYLKVKNLIKSDNFPWFYYQSSTIEYDENYINTSFYSHTFLLRPDENLNTLYPKITSDYFEEIKSLLVEIITNNNLQIRCFYRINANVVHPVNSDKLTVPHVDHYFPHKNILIYLNDAGGETVVFNEDGTFDAHHPQEDDVIIFEGLHCLRPPKEKRRIVLIATFI